MRLTLIDEDERKKILNQARSWVDAHGGFSSAKSVAVHAVIEFIANKQGKTFFSYMIGKESPIKD